MLNLILCSDGNLIWQVKKMSMTFNERLPGGEAGFLSGTSEIWKDHALLFYVCSGQQPTTNLTVLSFLSTTLELVLFHSELTDLLVVAGRDQSAADQPNNLAEGHPLL